MNGRRRSLRKGTGVVVDTHLLVEAAVRRRAAEGNRDEDIIDRIENVCAHLVLSARQRREAAPHFSTKGFRFPSQQVAYFAELEKLGKLRTVNKSAMRALSDKERKPFRKGSVRDDPHLYEAALNAGRMVVTRDVELIKRAGDIFAATGVETIDPDDA